MFKNIKREIRNKTSRTVFPGYARDNLLMATSQIRSSRTSIRRRLLHLPSSSDTYGKKGGGGSLLSFRLHPVDARIIVFRFRNRKNNNKREHHRRKEQKLKDKRQPRICAFSRTRPACEFFLSFCGLFLRGTHTKGSKGAGI